MNTKRASVLNLLLNKRQEEQTTQSDNIQALCDTGFRLSRSLEMKSEKYCVKYDFDNHRITFQGVLMLLSSEEGDAMVRLLESAALELKEKPLAIDLTDLEFLDGAGFGILLGSLLALHDVNITESPLDIIIKPGCFWQEDLKLTVLDNNAHC